MMNKGMPNVSISAKTFAANTSLKRKRRVLLTIYQRSKSLPLRLRQLLEMPSL